MAKFTSGLSVKIEAAGIVPTPTDWHWTRSAHLKLNFHLLFCKVASGLVSDRMEGCGVRVETSKGIQLSRGPMVDQDCPGSLSPRPG